MKRIIIQIILAAAAVFLGFKIYSSVMKPIEFKKQQKVRYDATIQKLKEIRKLQQAYKAIHGKYTGSWDTLAQFAKTDSFELTKIIGTYDLDKFTEEQALDKGIVSKEVTKVSVIDSLLGRDYPVDSLKYVPYTDGDTFAIDAGKLQTGSKIAVNVFQVNVPDTVLLDGLPKQLVYNFTDERWKKTGYAGLKVGSMTEATNDAGNWE